MQLCGCLQQVNICCACVGDISAEIKTEADSNDISECACDHMPNTGVFAGLLIIIILFYIIFNTIQCNTALTLGINFLRHCVRHRT